MNNIRRILMRAAVVVAGVTILAGCCVLPPHGWKHGGRHWDSQAPGHGQPGPYPGDGGYPRRR